MCIAQFQHWSMQRLGSETILTTVEPSVYLEEKPSFQYHSTCTEVTGAG